MYTNMKLWLEIRRRVLVEGVSKRQIIRETGLHWQTLEKILQHASPPGYCRSKPVRKPKIAPYLDRIEQIIKSDKDLPRKQRHTAKRIWERLQEEGFIGGYTIVKEAVRQIKATRQWVQKFQKSGQLSPSETQTHCTRWLTIPPPLCHSFTAMNRRGFFDWLEYIGRNRRIITVWA